MAEWIDVNERLPKEGERVIVFYWCAEDYTQITVGEYIGGNVGFLLDDDNQELLFVTQWQPLPLPGKCKKCGSEMGVSRDILIDRDYDLFKNLILADARNYPAWLLKLRAKK